MATTTIKKKKKCVKGFECGFTCIKQGLKCAESKQKEAKDYLEALERNIKDTFSAGDPEVTPEVVDTPDEVTYKDLLAKGKTFVGALGLGDYESADAYEIILIREEIAALRDQSISELSSSNTLGMKNKKLQALDEKKKELETRYRATLEDIEDKLILGLRKTVGLTSREAENSLDKLHFEIPKAYIDPIKSIMSDFIQLVGTSALGTLDTIVSEEERAYANAGARLIDVGKITNATILFHEMAHHFETSNPGLAEAAQGWLKSRATSETPESLSKLTGVGEYDDDDERAYPDDFIAPYVGKFYDFAATEVYSMGLERFSNSEGLLDLLRKDPEHAMLIIGAILHANKK